MLRIINEIERNNDWRKVSRRKEEFTAQNAPTVADYEYTYSKGLHLIGKQENTENRRTAYQYDSYYRLRRVDYDCDYSSSDPTCANNRNNVFKCNAAETDCEDFQLDGVHNIRSSYENQTNFAWTVDGFNRLEHKSWNNNTTTYSYDSNNNMTGEDLDGDNNPEIVYTYDKLNRLTSVANSDYLVEYSYDPFNRRTEKTVYYADGNDTFERTHKYAYNDWDIISEEIKTVRTSDNPASTTAWEIRRYVDQGTDNHIIMDTVSCSDDGNGNCSPNESTLQRIWFHKDERGNVIAVSDGDGTIYERYRYRVYGEHEVLNADFTPKSTAAASPFLWGGSLYEPETGLYWMRNRYYHIDMHRFINQDPIGIWGDTNNLGNGFAYVAGMVIEASDPTGLKIIFWLDSKYPCNEDMVNTITEIANTNSVVAELWDTAYNKDDDVYIECNKESGSNTAKDPDTGKYIINIGNETYTPAEKTAHELTHFIKHQSLVDKLADKPMDDLKQEIENYKKSGSIIDRIKAWFLELQQNYRQKEIDKAESEAVEKQQEAKEEEEKNKKGGEQYPADPDSAADKIQSYFANQFIKKILEMHEKKSFFEMMEEVGPIIRYEDNGRKIFFFNPYYRGKDPLKEIIWNTRNADGTRGFVRNPFVPGAEYGYDSSTYEKFQQAGFPQTNVDPYWQ